MPPGFFVQGLAGRLLLAAVAGLAMAVTTYLCAWINMRNAIGYRWPHERAFQQLEDLKSALDKFRQGEGKYPEKLSELSNPPPQFTRIEDSGEVLDPWENPYQYHVEGGGYTLFSFGRDGRHGGQGLDQDLDVKDLSRGVGPESWHNTVAIPTLWQFTFEMRDSGDAVDLCSGRCLCVPHLPECPEKAGKVFLEVVPRTGSHPIGMLHDGLDNDRSAHPESPLISCNSYICVTHCSVLASSSISSIGGYSRGSGTPGSFTTT